MADNKPMIMSLVGARPQFIKLAPLAIRLNKKFNHIIVHSGQHYDFKMSAVFFRQLEIPRPRYNLSIGSGHHGEMTAGIMAEFEKLLLRRKPHMVIVYGDTNSTIAGGLAAAKLHIPVAHVEAGLRSFNMEMPEEVNRVLTDHISNILFCPTKVAIENLKNEGIKRGIVRSGDLMYELIDVNRRRIATNKKVLAMHELEADRYYFITMHRPANVDSKEKLTGAVETLMSLDKPVLFPAHPRTVKNLNKFRLMNKVKKSDNIILAEPLSYLDNLSAIYYASAVMTDSGGIQKESVFLGTPCLTLRKETEWLETLKWGNHLVGLSERKIKQTLKKVEKPLKPVNYKIRAKKPSEIITSALAKYVKNGKV